MSTRFIRAILFASFLALVGSSTGACLVKTGPSRGHHVKHSKKKKDKKHKKRKKHKHDKHDRHDH